MQLTSSPGREIKGAFDFCGALALAALLAAPALLIAGLVRLSSRGPLLIRQQRLGKGGAPFTLYKFRTMRPDAEDGVPVWAVSDDPRCTRLGGFLRRTGLDEIPQLWNVLRGEMSLVGPRPERPHFAAHFARSLPDYPRRHQVRPGLTGLAQTRGWRGDTSVSQRLRSDLEYISRWSPALDFSILCQTVRQSVGQFKRKPCRRDGVSA